jgi:hypothetical protein
MSFSILSVGSVDSQSAAVIQQQDVVSPSGVVEFFRPWIHFQGTGMVDGLRFVDQALNPVAPVNGQLVYITRELGTITIVADPAKPPSERIWIAPSKQV